MIINTVTESNTNPTRNNVLAKVDNLKKKNFYLANYLETVMKYNRICAQNTKFIFLYKKRDVIELLQIHALQEKL